MQVCLTTCLQDAVKATKRTRGSTATVDTLRKDAENQKAIMAKKGKKQGPTETVAHSMTPHLAMHSTRGVESGRGRRELKKQKVKYQKSVYGKLALPPDEATPFFTTYVLHYAFPTIAIICTCLGCVLLRTMKMYQKERWKGTSYFHGKLFEYFYAAYARRMLCKHDLPLCSLCSAYSSCAVTAHFQGRRRRRRRRRRRSSSFSACMNVFSIIIANMHH